MARTSERSWYDLLRSHRSIVLIACIGLGVRLSFFLPVHAGGYTSDEREYVSMAARLVEGGEYIDSNGERSTRAPLFPYCLALLFTVTSSSVVAAHVFGCALGTVAVVLAYLLGLQIWHDRQAALIAAAVMAAYPGLVIYSGLLQTEMLYIVFFLLALLCAYSAHNTMTFPAMAGVGLFSALAALTRAVFLGFFPLLLVLLWWRKGDEGGPRIAHVMCALLVFCVMVAPWTIRNYEIHHALVPVSSGGGNSLLTGNNPFATGTWRVRPGFEQWYAEQAKGFGVSDLAALSEVEKGALSGNIARSYMAAHPLDAVRLMAKKAHVLFVYPITHSDSLVPLQAFAVGFDFLLLVGAVIGFVASFGARRRMGFVYMALAFFPLVQIVLHSESRFRLPLVPLLCLFCGIGIATAADSERLKDLLSFKHNRYAVVVLLGIVAVLYSITGIAFVKGSL